MNVQHPGWDLHVRPPAKLNLFFEVLGKRSDGFHEIETLMTPIDLHDELFFADDPSGEIRLDCRWAVDRAHDAGSLGELPSETNNLAYRAVKLLQSRAGVSNGAKMWLVKRIPAAAGLGGGSSDAAAALVAANRVWQLGWNQCQLAEVAAELGSDVPFFLGSGAALCRGRGEQITQVGSLGAWHAVVVRPPAGLSTAEVYGRCQQAAQPAPSERVVDAFRRGDFHIVGKLLFNRLEAAAEQLSPWIARLRYEFQRLGCHAAQMSGSGSSYFGLCQTARQAARWAAALKSRDVGQVYSVRFAT